MRKARMVLAVAGAVVLALSACGTTSKEPQLMRLRSTTDGPDEFAILPPKPLEMPADLAALPDPTPNGGNLTDQHPMDDAIVALGGTPRAVGGAVPAGDGGLVTYAARHGVTADIRQVMAADDLDWRRKNDGRLLERLFSVNVYFKAYRAMMLDQFAELARWRLAGVRTPSAPPPQKNE